MYNDKQGERIIQEKINKWHNDWDKSKKKHLTYPKKRRAHKYYIKKELRRAQ